MRLISIIAAMLVLIWGGEAFAQGNGNGNGNAYGLDNGGGNGNAADGNAGNPLAPGQNKTPKTHADQDEALKAVRAGESLPLATLVEKAQRATGARVIDAKLVRIEGRLLYLLTTIDERGRVARSYWYGRTGNRVQVN
jgi:hypothetical protein